MKYIRTKSNIYKMLDECMQTDLPPTKLRVENVKKGWHIIIYKSQIIKLADTIEELCDEFVCILFSDEGEFKWQHKAQNITIQEIKKYWHENMTCLRELYGAIWTDKGLIYVAKMNEKGELELL